MQSILVMPSELEEKRVLEGSRGSNIIIVITTCGWSDRAARLFSQDWAVEYNFSLEPSQAPSCQYNTLSF